MSVAEAVHPADTSADRQCQQPGRPGKEQQDRVKDPAGEDDPLVIGARLGPLQTCGAWSEPDAEC